MSHLFEVSPPTLEGEANYKQWADTMMIYFQIHRFDAYITGAATPPVEPESRTVTSAELTVCPIATQDHEQDCETRNEQWNKWYSKDAQMRLLILTSMAESIQAIVRGDQTAKEMWATIREAYSMQCMYHATCLYKQFHNLKLSDLNGDVNKYCREFTIVKNALAKAGCIIKPAAIYNWQFLEGLGMEYQIWQRTKLAEHRALRPDEDPQTVESLMAELRYEARLNAASATGLATRGSHNRRRGQGQRRFNRKSYNHRDNTAYN